jgi:hypothetical protein
VIAAAREIDASHREKKIPERSTAAPFSSSRRTPRAL